MVWISAGHCEIEQPWQMRNPFVANDCHVELQLASMHMFHADFWVQKQLDGAGWILCWAFLVVANKCLLGVFGATRHAAHVYSAGSTHGHIQGGLPRAFEVLKSARRQ